MATLIPILLRVLGRIALPIISKLVGSGIELEAQSVIFDKKKYTLAKAKQWLKQNGYKVGKVDTTQHYHRFRQMDPKKFKKFRTIKIKPGILIILGSM